MLDLDEIISPYEKTLNKMKKNERDLWAKLVLQKLNKKYDFDKTGFIILAGVKYRENLIPHFKYYKIPLEGLSFGKQLSKLKELTK